MRALYGCMVTTQKFFSSTTTRTLRPTFPSWLRTHRGGPPARRRRAPPCARSAPWASRRRAHVQTALESMETRSKPRTYTRSRHVVTSHRIITLPPLVPASLCAMSLKFLRRAPPRTPLGLCPRPRQGLSPLVPDLGTPSWTHMYVSYLVRSPPQPGLDRAPSRLGLAAPDRGARLRTAHGWTCAHGVRLSLSCGHNAVRNSNKPTHPALPSAQAQRGAYALTPRTRSHGPWRQ